jgi:colanic acid/amylovoran biosynthesis glycosyltransferase
MRILYYSDHCEGDSFITRQVDEVSDSVEVFYACQTADTPVSAGSLNSRIYIVNASENKIIAAIRRRLELSDWYLNYKNKQFADGIRKIVHELRPDIIHCQYGYDAIKLLDNYYDPNQKYVITFRGFDASLLLILSKYVNKLKYYLAKPNVYPVFVCNNLRSNLLCKGILLNPINAVVYSNTDTAFYSRQTRSLPSQPRVFTQVSNFREKKGHYFTLLAFNEFLKKNPTANFTLNFVGDLNAEYENLRQKAGMLPVMEKVKFLGKKNRNEIKEVLERSHVFVHNSITSKHNDQEGIPNAIMEAMAMEMPILATKHSGIPELLTGNEDVFLSEEKNINEYVMNIERVLEVDFSARNRQRIVESFSRENFKRNILAFYEKVQQNKDYQAL